MIKIAGPRQLGMSGAHDNIREHRRRRGAAEKYDTDKHRKKAEPYRKGFPGFGVCLIRLGGLSIRVSKRDHVKSEGKLISYDHRDTLIYEGLG